MDRPHTRNFTLAEGFHDANLANLNGRSHPMSQPEQGLTRQIRRHRGPLIGMLIVVLLALAAFFWWIGYEVQQSGSPEPLTATVTEPAPAAETTADTTKVP
jgi:hypothetical protein